MSYKTMLEGVIRAGIEQQMGVETVGFAFTLKGEGYLEFTVIACSEGSKECNHLHGYVAGTGNIFIHDIDGKELGNERIQIV